MGSLAEDLCAAQALTTEVLRMQAAADTSASAAKEQPGLPSITEDSSVAPEHTGAGDAGSAAEDCALLLWAAAQLSNGASPPGEAPLNPTWPE